MRKSGRIQRGTTTSPRPATRRTTKSKTAGVEWLEDRRLLSVTVPDTYGYEAYSRPLEAAPLTPGGGVVSIFQEADDHTVAIDLGANTFNFYGVPYSGKTLHVSANGLMSFNTAYANYANDTLDSTTVTMPAIAPLWDDWRTFGEPGEQLLYKLDADKLTVQWTMFHHYFMSDSTVTFQAELELNTADEPGVITFNYFDLSTDQGPPTGEETDNGASATVGIKSTGYIPTSRLLVSYNNAGNDWVREGRSIRITTNEAPVLSPVGPFTFDEGQPVTLAASATDVDGDPLTYAWDFDGDGAYETAGATPLFSPGRDGPFEQTVRVQVTDGHRHVATASALVRIVNVAPTAYADTFSGPEDRPISGTLRATDPANAHAATSTTEPLASEPLTADSGDPTELTADASTAEPLTSQPLTSEPLTSEPITSDLLASEPLAAGATPVDTLTIELVQDGGPLHGSVVLSADGLFTYTPEANYFGDDRFTYRVRDEDGGVSAPAVVSLSVTAVNDAPTGRDNAYAVNEDSTLNVAAPGLLANDADVEGDALTAVPVAGRGPAHGTLSLNADGSFSYTPAPNFNGSDSFTYRAEDASGAGSEAVVTIEVGAVNDAPVAVADAVSTHEDVATSGNVLANDGDVEDGRPVRAELVFAPLKGTLALAADGTFTYTPAANSFDLDRFTYKAFDAAGAETAVTEVTIFVQEVNDVPVVTGETARAGHAEPLMANVLVNDTDADNDVLTATVLTPTTLGTLVLGTDGRFSYTPNAGAAGTDTFTYRVSDGRGGFADGRVTITVDEEPVPEPELRVQVVPDVTRPGLTALVVNGTANGELIAVLHAPGGFEVYFGCESQGVFQASGRVIVHGNDGNDVLLVGPGVQSVAWLYGDDGNDLLRLGHGGGIAFGGVGNDVVNGGNGRDVLVGGEGADALVGNPGDDVLISALTVFDDRTAAGHDAAWAGIRAEWASERSFADRVNNLRDGTGPAGRANGSYFLDDATLRDDSARDNVDVLTGSAGSDWFVYKFGEDRVTGLSWTEAQYDKAIA